MKSIEFYHGFIQRLIDGSSDNEHDNQIYQTMTDIFQSSFSILSEEETPLRMKRLIANLTFFDDQIENIGAYPPSSDMSASNISGGFAQYIDTHPLKNDFTESKGLSLSKLGGYVSSSSLSKIEYVAHRGLMNEAIRDFVHNFMHEVVRSPGADSIVRSDTMDKESKLYKIREMAKGSLISQVGRSREMGGPDDEIAP